MTHTRLVPIALGAMCFALLAASPAAAYVDPGGGSVLLQLLLGGGAGLVALLRLSWHRFARRPQLPQASATDVQPSTQVSSSHQPPTE